MPVNVRDQNGNEDSGVVVFVIWQQRPSSLTKLSPSVTSAYRLVPFLPPCQVKTGNPGGFGLWIVLFSFYFRFLSKPNTRQFHFRHIELCSVCHAWGAGSLANRKRNSPTARAAANHINSEAGFPEDCNKWESTTTSWSFLALQCCLIGWFFLSTN